MNSMIFMNLFLFVWKEM